MAAAEAWASLDADLVRLIMSKRRTARFRATMLQVCKPWRSVILHKPFDELKPFLLNVDQRSLVDVICRAWNQPARLHTALVAAVGNVWTDARPPKGVIKSKWLREQILQNNWIETKPNGRHFALGEIGKAQRLRFKRGAVWFLHPLGNWECRIDNDEWSSWMTVDSDKLSDICPRGCSPDRISFNLRENLASELQLVLTITSYCLCYWYEHVGYGNPPEHFEETMYFAMVDSDDEDEDNSTDDEDSDDM